MRKSRPSMPVPSRAAPAAQRLVARGGGRATCGGSAAVCARCQPARSAIRVERTTYRVDVSASARSFTVFRYSGGAAVQSRVVRLPQDQVQIVQSAFTGVLAGALPTSVFFFPRGTASPGRIVLGTPGRARQHTIDVEGLTGRVSST